MWILLSPVITQTESHEIVGVLNQQLQWLRAALSRVKRIAEYLRGESAAVHGNNFHAGPNTRLGSGHAFDRVLDFAVLFENESDGERRVDRAVVLFPGTHHLGAVLVINQLPTAAFNSTQWRSRTLTGQLVGPKAAPII